MALLLSFQSTLGFRHIVNLSLRDSVANFLLNSVTLLGVFSLAFLFIPGGTFLLIVSGCNWLLNSLALLTGFIPALLIPDSVTARDATQSSKDKIAQQEYLKHDYELTSHKTVSH